MQYRHLGNSGLKVSEIGLGSWMTYGNSTERETAVKTIDAAYENGVTMFDTANFYALGEAEKIVGEALGKYPRSSYVLATKVFWPMGEGPNDRGLSRKHVFEELHKSLKRLNMEYVDLYYCHRYDPETPVEETLRTIDDMVRQGKILYVGVSEWTAAQIQEALGVADQYLLDRIVVNQPLYNVLERDIEKEIMPLCEKNGISQIVYSPLAQGVLTGKYTDLEHLPQGSRALDPKANMFMKKYLNDDFFGRVQKLKTIADGLGITLPMLAIAWILSHKNIATALVGASRPEQIRDNLKASGCKLNEDTLQAIDDVLA